MGRGDHLAAYDWMRLAAERGDARGRFELIVMEMSGLGGLPLSRTEAEQRLRALLGDEDVSVRVAALLVLGQLWGKALLEGCGPATAWLSPLAVTVVFMVVTRCFWRRQQHARVQAS